MPDKPPDPTDPSTPFGGLFRAPPGGFARQPTADENIAGMLGQVVVSVAEQFGRDATAVEQSRLETAKVNAGVAAAAAKAEEGRIAAEAKIAELRIATEAKTADKQLWLYGGIAVLVTAVILVALFTNKEDIAKDIIKFGAGALTGGASGYALGRRKVAG